MPSVKKRSKGLVEPKDKLASAKQGGKPLNGVKPSAALNTRQKSGNGKPTVGKEPNTSLSSHSKSNGKSSAAMKPTSVLTSQQQKQKKSICVMKPSAKMASICSELQALERTRVVYIKSRIKISNRIQAIIAGTLGYSAGMKDEERKKKMQEAGQLIKQISKGEIDHPMKELVLNHLLPIDGFLNCQKATDDVAVGFAKDLPVASWTELPEQRGFGIPRLAVIIGETGDLSNYANPAKVWKRMGCAPYSYQEQNLMGATWRGGKHGKLPASEWSEFGYSPRRRAIAYIVGELLLKLNYLVPPKKDENKKLIEGTGIPGPYRQRYLDGRRVFEEKHSVEIREKPKLYPPLRCHYHGMLLATKLLLKNLWIEWHNNL